MADEKKQSAPDNKKQPSIDEQVQEKEKEIADQEAQLEKVRSEKSREIEELKAKHDAEMRQKYGYLLNHDLKYDGEIIPAGSRHKLNRLKKEEIEKLLNDGAIS